MEPPGSVEHFGSADARLVGRDAELEAVRGVVDATHGNLARIVLLAGEPGVGKSCLAREIVATVPCRSVWSSCWEGDDAPSFWPWVQVLRALRSGESDAVGTGGGSLHDLLGARSDGDVHDARFRLFDAFADEIAAASAAGPLLVVIDDLHWADPGSIRLLRFLAVDPRARRLSVIGAYRDGSSGALAVSAADLCRNGLHLRLEGLDSDAVAQLCGQLGGHGVDTAALHRRSGGNPFFVREFVRLGDRAHGSLPVNVEAVVLLRLEATTPTLRTALDGASVLGASFDVTVLAAMLDRDPVDVVNTLDEACTLGLIAPTSAGMFDFGHAVVQEVLYAKLRPGDRVRLHARAATILDQQSAGRAVLSIAHHRRLGTVGPDSAAAHAAEVAAAWAFDTLAYEQSATWFGHALTLLVPGTDPVHEADLLIRRGEAALAAGDVAVGRDAFRQAAAAGRECGSADVLARAALGWGSGQGGFEVPLHDATQIALLHEALEAVGPEPGVLRARLQARLSVAWSGSDDEHRRQGLSEDAIRTARSTGDAAALGHALAAHCDSIAGPDHSEQRRDEAGEIVSLASRVGDRPLELLGRRLRAAALLEMGDIAGFDVEVARFADLADRLRQPMYGWYVPLWHGLRSLMRGELDAASVATDAARQIGERAESMNAFALTFTQWWVSERMQGRSSQSAVEMRTVLGFDPGGQPLAFGDTATRLRAVIATQLDDRASAHALLDVLVATGLQRRPKDAEWLPEMAQLAEVAAFAGHPAAVAEIYELLRPYAHRFCVEGIGAAFIGSVHWYLAMLARVNGDELAASDHALEAREAHGRVGLIGDPPPLAPHRGLTAAAPVTALHREGSLVAEGATWAITFDGLTRRLRASKGLRDLAVLLRRPHQEVHCLELAGGIDFGGDTGPALDDEARRVYQQRIRDLQEDIEDANTANDLIRAERAEAELDALVAQLTHAFGLSGRARPQGSATERARTTVTSRIRAAIRQIDSVHPDVGRHLQHSVRTGIWCAYAPEHTVNWHVEIDA
jgi:AAA ATPase domain